MMRIMLMMLIMVMMVMMVMVMMMMMMMMMAPNTTETSSQRGAFPFPSHKCQTVERIQNHKKLNLAKTRSPSSPSLKQYTFRAIRVWWSDF